MEIFRAILLQTRRGSTPRESLRLALKAVSRLEVQGGVLFMNENWLSRHPITLEEYSGAAESIARKFPGPVFAGTNYVLDEEGVVRSVGLSVIDGKVRRVCEKLFPSRAVGEREAIAPGRLYGPVTVEGWQVSCIACVDIFYPEIARAAALLGADIIYNPASIPSDRVELWHSVLLTRASENTVFTIGVNSVGYVYPDGRITLGGSIVEAPNGIEIARHTSREGGLEVLLYRQLIERIRERWAFYDDLRGVISGLYPRIETLIGKTILRSKE